MNYERTITFTDKDNALAVMDIMVEEGYSCALSKMDDLYLVDFVLLVCDNPFEELIFSDKCEFFEKLNKEEEEDKSDDTNS